jgi:archaetidylinositol phosphate synthase
VKTRRENSSILFRAELAIIERVLPHIPRVISPDHLTYLGLAGACLTAVAFAGCLISAAFLPIAIIGLFLNWIGDSFDGGLARYRSKERPQYGFMIDHSIDLLSTSLILIGLGASPYLPFDSACFALIIYLLFCGFVYIKVSTEGVHVLAFGRLGATEFRILVGAWALLIHVFHLQGIVNAKFAEWHVLRGRAVVDLITGIACCLAFAGLVRIIFRDAARLKEKDMERLHSQADPAKVIEFPLGKALEKASA